MVPRRKLVIMVGTSLVALLDDELGRPWTTHHCTAIDDDRGTLLASNPPEKWRGMTGVSARSSSRPRT
jgi:hypothetical protein